VFEADRGERDGHLGQRFGTDGTEQVVDRVVHAVQDHAGRQQPVELRSELLEDRRPGVGHLPLLGVQSAMLGQVGAQRRHALRAGDRICAGGQGGIDRAGVVIAAGRRRSICVCEVVMTETIQSRLTSMPGSKVPAG